MLPTLLSSGLLTPVEAMVFEGLKRWRAKTFTGGDAFCQGGTSATEPSSKSAHTTATVEHSSKSAHNLSTVDMVFSTSLGGWSCPLSNPQHVFEFAWQLFVCAECML